MRLRHAVALLATAALGIGAILLAAPPTGAHPSPTAAAGSAEAKVTDPVPLLELATADQKAYLWTLSEHEAASAVADYHMTMHPAHLGYLRRNSFAGSQPIYRLRTGTAYLLTASADERTSLLAGGKFVDDGILGYSAKARQPGTAPLWRMSNAAGWRVIPDAQKAAMTAQGYRTDGSLGYVYPTYDRAGAIYFGTFDPDGNQAMMQNIKAVYGRDQDWWGGLRDFTGTGVPLNKWHWPDVDFSDRKPAIGYYDDSKPATLQKQITQAAGAGLRYFTFYWYWNPADGGHEQYVDGLKAFLEANNRSKMNFNVMPCLHPWSDGPVSLHLPSDQITKAANTIVDSYLGQPNYLRANDGRPIISVCDTRGIGNGTADGMDTAATKAFTDAIRAEAQKKYGEDVLITLNADLGAPPANTGFDGSACQGQWDPSRSYQHYVDNQRAYFANFQGLLMRCATSGFDERPRIGILIPDPGKDATEQQLEAAFRWYGDQSVARYGQLLDNVQADIDASTRPATVDNFVLLYAWNEWHEGGYIEP
ncbi:MAG TPA: glycoside hydrolase family 99-like domain-containing protein, partial [Mycobacteriales bacterium]|nr:glycoside hydrolase family 99-like domain-containing protein [Mycobacteriales bacterium]